MANKIRLGFVGANVSSTWSAQSHFPALLGGAGIAGMAAGDTVPSELNTHQMTSSYFAPVAPTTSNIASIAMSFSFRMDCILYAKNRGINQPSGHRPSFDGTTIVGVPNSGTKT